MPELPEVETIARAIRPILIGRRIDAVLLNRSSVLKNVPRGTFLEKPLSHQIFLSQKLGGRHVADISRRAKRIVFTLDDGNRFYIHLGMSGRLTLEPTGVQVKRHTHFVATFGQDELRFTDPRRFGGIFWVGETGQVDEGLGPEPLTMPAAELARRLAKTSRAIKNALLDQSLIAGLGNIYVDESLHEANIHPLTPANKLSRVQVSSLTRSIKRVLDRALEHRGSTLRDYRDARGKPGNFQNLHQVYQRSGKPCLKCKTVIERIIVGGRSTHFCPSCQAKRDVSAK